MFGLLKKFREGLQKTSARLVTEIKRIVTGAPRLDAATLDELEAALIGADLGVGTAMEIVERVRQAAATQREVDVVGIARAEIERELRLLPSVATTARDMFAALGREKPVVVLMVGVNGTGKTTTTAKLAYWLKQQGHTVLLAAADTFRAAAIEQLQLWGQRVGCEVIAGQYGADSAAVAFDALQAARRRGVDFLVVDTAGRLHTKKNLMEEMKKIHRSLQKVMPSAPHETWLVLDGTTGMNALVQAREFHQALGVTGLVVTKLDGTAKGGIVVAIARELKIPVRFVGLGEQADDLQPFDPAAFAAGLFGQETVSEEVGGGFSSDRRR
ncbi:MAG: signal recognition particle-docking protein FtsY [Verrucomicrobiae bacterium]|nr:signal recognition particle-docking protein FtsY [Verrucomicrobiae bacterium]